LLSLAEAWAVIAAGPKFRQRRIVDRIPEETRRSASRSSAGGTRHDTRREGEPEVRDGRRRLAKQGPKGAELEAERIYGGLFD